MMWVRNHFQSSKPACDSNLFTYVDCFSVVKRDPLVPFVKISIPLLSAKKSSIFLFFSPTFCVPFLFDVLKTFLGSSMKFAFVCKSHHSFSPSNSFVDVILGSSSTKSMTPPSSTSTPASVNHSTIQRRGSTISMPTGDFDNGERRPVRCCCCLPTYPMFRR